MEIAIERRFRDVSLSVRPQQRREHRSIDVTSAMRDQRSQKLKRFSLRLAFRHQRFTVAADHKFAERADRDRPWPIGCIGGGCRELSLSNQITDEIRLDLPIER